jgi:hypothetical protein
MSTDENAIPGSNLNVPVGENPNFPEGNPYQIGITPVRLSFSNLAVNRQPVDFNWDEYGIRQFTTDPLSFGTERLSDFANYNARTLLEGFRVTPDRLVLEQGTNAPTQTSTNRDIGNLNGEDESNAVPNITPPLSAFDVSDDPFGQTTAENNPFPVIDFSEVDVTALLPSTEAITNQVFGGVPASGSVYSPTQPFALSNRYDWLSGEIVLDRPCPGSIREQILQSQGTIPGTATSGGTQLPSSLGLAPQSGVNETGNASSAISFFQSQGWTRAQAIGIVANLQAESGINMSTNAVGDGGRAYGIAQWHPDRQANFQRAFGIDIRQAGFQQQLEFVQWELENTERNAANRLRSVTGTGSNAAAQAAAIVDQFYERSSGAHRQRRMQYAVNLSSSIGSPNTSIS